MQNHPEPSLVVSDTDDSEVAIDQGPSPSHSSHTQSESLSPPALPGLDESYSTEQTLPTAAEPSLRVQFHQHHDPDTVQFDLILEFPYGQYTNQQCLQAQNKKMADLSLEHNPFTSYHEWVNQVRLCNDAEQMEQFTMAFDSSSPHSSDGVGSQSTGNNYHAAFLRNWPPQPASQHQGGVYVTLGTAAQSSGYRDRGP